MIIKQVTRNVTTSQEFETIKYGVSMENLAMLFKLLRTNLYSDLHGSIIREVVTNVDDAHIEAGKPDAFGEIEWVVANRLLGIDTQLIIRDFGVGLSPDRMKNIYGNYLASTKRDSNDQTGGFGLGSKSPFAYTDSFFVDTVFDSVQYRYLCYIDTTDLGAISLMSSEETTMSNRTEIIIPIKKDWEDKNKFQAAINRQLSYFRNIKYIGIDGPDNEILYEDDNCIILKNPPIANTHVILGKIAYEIDFSQITHTEGLTNCGVGLKFPVGALQPTMSREKLYWNEATKTKVEAAIRRARRSVRLELQNEIQTETDYAKWFALVDSGQTKRFPNHIDFSEIKGLGTFTTSLGQALPVANRLENWFAGHNVRCVTPYQGGNRRRRYSSAPLSDPDYTAVQAITKHLVNLPIYQLERNLNGRTALYLFTKHPKGFIAVSHLEKPDEPELLPYYNETRLWMAKLDSFDRVKVPDDFMYTGSSFSSDDYKKIVQQRKLEGKFTAKKLQLHHDGTTELADQFTYSQFLSKFEDHKKGIIVYGFQEDHIKMCKVAAILQSHGPFVRLWQTGRNSSDYIFLKIGRHYSKDFAQMPNAYYIDHVMSLNSPLTSLFAEIHTAFRIKKKIHEYHILQFFNDICSEMHNKYVMVHAFVEEFAKLSCTSIRMQPFLEEISKNNFNQEMEDAYSDILEYFKGVELLNGVNFDMYSWYHTGPNNGRGYWAEFLYRYVKSHQEVIKKYLLKAGKAVNNTSLPTVAASPVEPAEQEEEEHNPTEELDEHFPVVAMAQEFKNEEEVDIVESF